MFRRGRRNQLLRHGESVLWRTRRMCSPENCYPEITVTLPDFNVDKCVRTFAINGRVSAKRLLGALKTITTSFNF